MKFDPKNLPSETQKELNTVMILIISFLLLAGLIIFLFSDPVRTWNLIKKQPDTTAVRNAPIDSIILSEAPISASNITVTSSSKVITDLDKRKYHSQYKKLAENYKQINRNNIIIQKNQDMIIEAIKLNDAYHNAAVEGNDQAKDSIRALIIDLDKRFKALNKK